MKGLTTVMTDTLGRLTRMGYDGSGTLRWTKRNDGQLTVYQLDSLGRTVATIVNYQDGVVGGSEPADQDLITRTSYDLAGRQTQTTDTAGRMTAFAYDNLDRLIAVTENAVTGTCTQAPCNVITQYQYDRAGNRTAIIDANGHVRRFSYDAANQPAEARDALNNVTSWDYDPQGRVTTQHDPRGITNTLTYSYDNLDRLIARAATNLGTIGAAYDALGRRTSLTDGTGTTSFGYDGLSRIRSVQAPNTGHLGYDYDARGLRTKLIYPDGSALQYGYLADGQLHIVTGTTTLASYDYDTAGRLHTVTRANGATTTSTYDAADRLRDLRTTVGGSDVSRFQYSVDRMGLRTTAPETLSTTRTISYTYDGLQRLSGATESPGTRYAYAYDNAGNRTGVWLNGTRTVTQTFNAANQVNGFTYDAAGNLTSDGTTMYGYDALNRMTARGGTTYSYNGDGVLVDDGTTRYAQDLASPLSQILQTTQGSTTNYLYGLDRLAAVAGSTRTWYGTDALGSVRQTISNVGLPLSVVNYDPWGTVEGGSVPVFGFTGELQDAATGLVNLRARWYSTARGTFPAHRWRIEESSDDIPYSHHPYVYALSNPVLFTDPTGKCIPYVDPTCRPFWEEGVTYTGWEDFTQYSAGVVEGMGSLGAATANLTKAETWDAARRGLDYLRTDLNGSAVYLRQQLVDPMAHAALHPVQTLQTLNQNPRQLGRVLGSTAGALASASGISRISATIRRAFPGPKVSPYSFDPALSAGDGATDMLGNIRISPRGTMLDRMRAIYHEQVHSFFTPRGLGQVPRARFSQWMYNNSHLFRYVEEATAESVAQLRTGGSLRSGLRFPIVQGYVDPWRIAVEGVFFCGGTAVLGNEVSKALR